MSRNTIFIEHLKRLGHYCSGNNKNKMKNIYRPPSNHIITLAPQSVAVKIKDEDKSKANNFIKENKGRIPTKILEAIRKHEVWTGMSKKEVELSIGKLSKKKTMSFFISMKDGCLGSIRIDI